MTVDKYASLKLENQLCFPLYAVSKEIIRRYKPSLDKLDLTYTQYITMMVMWEKKQVNVKELGEKLLLDSGTLTPVLKKLEHKGYITRERSVTDKGMALEDEALFVPKQMACSLALTKEESETLYALLHKLLAHMEENGPSAD